MKYTENEELYLQAKDAYYLGDPIMTDAEFDELETELKDQNSSVTEIVGAETSSKVKHITPMASLAKIQFKNDYQPTKEFQSFVDKVKAINPHAELEFTPKYDGNSCNLIYKKGKFVKAISRGDGVKGQDLTEKVRNIVPDKISNTVTIEVRGEVLMQNSIFNEFYSDFKNPRNLVAGILGKDNLIFENLNRLTFIAFELRVSDSSGNYYHPAESTQLLNSMGFNKNYTFADYANVNDVDIIQKFNLFTEHRLNSKFLLDGIVCKAEESVRKEMGETSHHPKWALAIKFPPKSAISRVIDIEWNLGKTGKLTPVGILEPVDLDGTTVSRVTLHNYEWILTKKVAPGAVVEIVKSGDIIPAIVKVIEESSVEFDYPKFYEGLPTKIVEGKHLVVEDFETLPEFGASALHRGCSVMEMDYFGPAMCQRLFNAGFETVKDIFSSDFTHEIIHERGNNDFEYGSREVQRLIDEVKKFKEVELWRIINSMQFNRVGNSLSKEFAKYIAETDYNFKGFEKAMVSKFVDEPEQRAEIQEFLEFIDSRAIKVIMPENVNSDEIAGIYELTGSPKEFGFKTKADFQKLMKEKGFIHGKLNADAKYLITDDLESSSSKMKKAEKLGVEIKLYSDFS